MPKLGIMLLTKGLFKLFVFSGREKFAALSRSFRQD